MKSTIREKRILKYGSPYFNKDLPTIAASAVVAYMVKDINSNAAKYLPLDSIEVTNLSLVDISVCLDDGDSFVVPHGTIKTIEDKPFRRIRVTNRDTVSATGDKKILLQMQKLPITADTFIRRFKLK